MKALKKGRVVIEKGRGVVYDGLTRVRFMEPQDILFWFIVVVAGKTFRWSLSRANGVFYLVPNHNTPWVKHADVPHVRVKVPFVGRVAIILGPRIRPGDSPLRLLRPHTWWPIIRVH
jgi:hypothetical protein